MLASGLGVCYSLRAMDTETGKKKLKLGVLGSGKGSNLQAILDAVSSGKLNAEVVCVISDVENAYILERATSQGIPGLFISGDPFRTKLDGEGEKAYIHALGEHGADVIALAGFMRILKRGMLGAFSDRIVNIHPALLPAFPGVASWTQALEHGAKVAGCTVHLVDEGTDTGPIIVQRAVHIEEEDTPDTLHAMIQVEEHIAYPAALQLFADNRITVRGRRVYIEACE